MNAAEYIYPSAATSTVKNHEDGEVVYSSNNNNNIIIINNNNIENEHGENQHKHDSLYGTPNSTEGIHGSVGHRHNNQQKQQQRREKPLNQIILPLPIPSPSPSPSPSPTVLSTTTTASTSTTASTLNHEDDRKDESNICTFNQQSDQHSSSEFCSQYSHQSYQPTLSPQERTGQSNTSHQHPYHQQDDYPHQPQQLRRQKYLLTVFQAAPLVWLEETAEKKFVPQPMSVLDFDFERQLLTQTFREACGDDILVEFEIATTDRLGLFLAKNEGTLLHFSCHGHPAYLALEDEWGGMMMLEVTRLKEWISAGGQNLKFVFVSACYSSIIGDAFVAAGVPHVVCCRYDCMLREDAAVEFEKFFYRNLACGKTVQAAFDLARHEVSVSSRIPADARMAEVQKFCLLPLDTDHNVEIFPRPKLPPKRQSPPIYLPLPPQYCMGRESDQYKLLQALKRSRLVRVSGARGIGKSTLVQSTCRHLNYRLHMVGFHEILWIPNDSGGTRELLPFKLFQNVLDMINEDFNHAPVLNFKEKARENITRLVEYFRVRKTLLVIEAKHILLQSDIQRLCIFVEELMKETQYLKVLAIHHIGFEITTNRMKCSEESIYIEPLDLKSSVNLFCRLCPHHHANAPSINLGEILERQQAERNDALREKNKNKNYNDAHHHPNRMSKRMSDIYNMVGEGIPTNIHHAAKNMPISEYHRLLTLIQESDIVFLCQSRTELVLKQYELSEEISKAALCRDFKKAQRLQYLHDDLELQKEDFPDISQLQKEHDEKTYQIDLAMYAKNWSKAQSLQDELDKLEAAIRAEINVVGDALIIDEGDAVLFQTRALLETKLFQLSNDHKNAWEANDYAKAREIHAEIQRLVNARSQKPSRAEYAKTMNLLQTELGSAKADRNLDAAEMIYNRLVEVKEKLKLEEEAEMELGISVEDGDADNDDGTNGINGDAGRRRVQDPPGNIPLVTTLTAAATTALAAQKHEPVSSSVESAEETSRVISTFKTPLQQSSVDPPGSFDAQPIPYSSKKYEKTSRTKTSVVTVLNEERRSKYRPSPQSTSSVKQQASLSSPSSSRQHQRRQQQQQQPNPKHCQVQIGPETQGETTTLETKKKQNPAKPHRRYMKEDSDSIDQPAIPSRAQSQKETAPSKPSQAFGGFLSYLQSKINRPSPK